MTRVFPECALCGGVRFDDTAPEADRKRWLNEIVGIVMKNSGGSANPALVEKVIRALQGERVSFAEQRDREYGDAADLLPRQKIINSEREGGAGSEGTSRMSAARELPDDWFIEETGERTILDKDKVVAEIARLRLFLETIALDGVSNSVSSETLGYMAKDALDGAEKPER